MSDKEKSSENPGARTDRPRSTMPDCCGPVVERMFKAFGDTTKTAANGESARDSEWIRSCASMMEEMASRCCSPSPQRTTSDE